ncbi:hypothetical protein HZA55_03095 [Candidatus Poribacteria bacterium]|nr:hypothetical protein [Candidatus Poribacteria bacterium]
MKIKSLFLIFATLLLAFALACGGGAATNSITGGGDSNRAPNKPYNPAPSDGLTGCPINQSLSWISAGDPDDIPILNPSDIVNFNVYFGESNNPGYVGNATNTFYTPNNALTPGRTYYWRVEAVDKKGAKTSSDTWKFSVFGYSNVIPPVSSNNPPLVPVALYPALNSVDQPYSKIALFWYGGDLDPDDFVKYNLYFDTGRVSGVKMTDVQKKATGLFASRFDFTNLLPNKNYSWQVEAVDSKGNTSISAILYFKTASTTSTANSKPYPPFNPKPENGDGGQPNKIMLSWNVEDPDEQQVVKSDTTYVYDTTTGLVIADSTKIYYDTLTIYDTLTCDLYLSKVSGDVDSKAISAQVVASNPSTNYFDSLEVDNMYFWKVVVKDNHNNTTDGPTWNFYTGNWHTAAVGNPPFVPSDPQPFNGDQNAPTYLSLNWFGGDPDGDYVTYELKGDRNFDNLKNDNPEFIVSDLPSTNFFIPEPLESNTWYYWQITAKDSNGNTSKGDIWSFKTGWGGGANNDMPPWVGNPNPWDWANFQPLWINLTWDGGDPNPEDRVFYEVYFGEADQPGAPFWQTETEQRNWSPSYPLISGKRYVWKIVAKSKKSYGGFGGTSEGPVWSFSTGIGYDPNQNQPPFIPTVIYPGNQNDNIPTTISLSWNGGDPDGDGVEYELYFEKNDSYPDPKGKTYNTSYPITLEQNTTYYWYIIANDMKGHTVKSQTWKFKTASYSNTVNNPPNKPNNPQPFVGQDKVPSYPNLSWVGGDPDPGDFLTYEVVIDANSGMLSTTPFIRISNLSSPNCYVDRMLNSNMKYYWQVIANDGKSGGITKSDIWSFTTGIGGGNMPPFMPGAPTPYDWQYEVSTYVTLSWMGGDPTPGEFVDYDIYLGTDSNPNNLPYYVTTYNMTSYSVFLMPNTTYYWYVKANDHVNPPVKGPVWRFTTTTGNNNAPWVNLSYPYNGAINEPVNIDLSWYGGDPDWDLVNYEVHIGTTINNMPIVSNTTSTSYWFQGDINTTYFWYVSASDSKGGTVKTQVWSFKTTSFINSAPWINTPIPSDRQGNQPLYMTLNWQGGDINGDSVTYEIYLGTNRFALYWIGNTYSYNNTSNSFGYNEGLQQGTTYFWQVVATDSNGATTNSEIWQFTTGYFNNNNLPWVSSPTPYDWAYDQQLYVNLYWYGYDQDGDFINYDIYLGTDMNYLSWIGNTYNYTNYYYPMKLNSGTTYYWRVDATDSKGGKSTGSTWRFTTGYANNAPWVSSPYPFDLSTDQSQFANLSWAGGDAEGDYVNYEIYLGTSPYNLQSKGFTYNYTSFMYSTKLDANTWYYWQIKATDSQSATTWGPVWSFQTGSPLNNSPWVNNPNPWDWAYDQPLYINLSWSGGDPDGDIVNYDLYLGTTANSLPWIGKTYNNTYFSYPTKLLQGTTYYWYVVATDNKGGIIQGPIWTFTTGTFNTNPPYIPYNPVPSDLYLGVYSNTTLSWSGGDPDGNNTVTYYIYIWDVNGNFVTDYVGFNNGSATSKYVSGLGKNKLYYWEIEAFDGTTSSWGPVWAFTTGPL